MNPTSNSRLRIAAIGFLNPAPLMWDFEHAPINAEHEKHYVIDRMSPSECAERLANGTADIGLIPIAALATNPSLCIVPGCTIASKGLVRSLILVRRADRKLNQLRAVAADTASRTTVAYARILFHKWGNAEVPFVPMAANLDQMLARADAAIVIGDPALLALEESHNRLVRTGEELVYHDLAEEWRMLNGLPFVSAVWSIACGSSLSAGRAEIIAQDLNQSRIHGQQNIDALVHEWSRKLPIPEATIRTYLTTNIHYTLDEECIEGMRGFYRLAAELNILPEYSLKIDGTRTS